MFTRLWPFLVKKTHMLIKTIFLTGELRDGGGKRTPIIILIIIIIINFSKHNCKILFGKISQQT